MTSSTYAYPTDDKLADLLRIRASWLSYLAFALCCQRLLADLGYEEMRMLGRTSLRGRTPLGGGVDMEAVAPMRLGRVPTFIQLKRYQRTVPRRFVDELRGSMQRFSVPQGISISTAHYSQRAQEAAQSFEGRPVRLIDGKELGQLMLAARIGVRESTDVRSGAVRLSLNDEAFAELEAYCIKLKRTKQPYPLMPFQ